MIFVIDYDRLTGRLVALKTYEKNRLKEALEARLNLELELKHQGVDREVVLLEAPNEEALRKTHGRYFQTVREITQEAVETLR